MKWKKGYSWAKNDRFLATYPYAKNEERQKEIHYSHPIVQDKMVCFTQKGETLNFDKPLSHFLDPFKNFTNLGHLKNQPAPNL